MHFIRSIVSTGTQYFDTGVYVKENTRVVCGFRYTAKPATTACLFRLSNFGFGWQSSGVFRSWGGSTYSFPTTFSAVERHIVDKRSTVCILDGVEAATTAHLANTSHTLVLLAYNNEGTISQFSSLELDFCQIYEGDILIRDYWPCIDDNSVVCLYDKVTETYLYNAGTGEFIVGFAPVLFRRRPKVSTAKPAAVTITGSGNSTYCYATVNGTKYTSAASGIEVMTGDVITFVVHGRSSTYYGDVTVDGKQELKVTNNTTQTYDWTVPKGVTTIAIKLSYPTTSSQQRRGNITVTTS